MRVNVIVKRDGILGETHEWIARREPANCLAIVARSKVVVPQSTIVLFASVPIGDSGFTDCSAGLQADAECVVLVAVGHGDGRRAGVVVRQLPRGHLPVVVVVAGVESGAAVRAGLTDQVVAVGVGYDEVVGDVVGPLLDDLGVGPVLVGEEKRTGIRIERFAIANTVGVVGVPHERRRSFDPRRRLHQPVLVVEDVGIGVRAAAVRAGAADLIAVGVVGVGCGDGVVTIQSDTGGDRHLSLNGLGGQGVGGFGMHGHQRGEERGHARSEELLPPGAPAQSP
jgi:hypothetical protein